MALNVRTPWHKASYEAFLNERLPALLAERLPLIGYAVEATGTHTCRVTVTLAAASNGCSDRSPAAPAPIVTFDLPQPDDSGRFKVGDTYKVVIPLADRAELDQAHIRCVGEQFYDVIAARLGQAPVDLPWDDALARAWLSLDAWGAEFLRDTAQSLDTANWLAEQTHLRSLRLPEGVPVITPGQRGRVCPFETPEGPNIGRILRVALGADIQDGKLVVLDERPQVAMSLSAAMIPFLEHNDPNRTLMGANMLRQWIPQQTPEPAWVQTGNEPDAARFWNGRNLLTAFVSWGAGTFEDGLVVSESCAQRFDAPYPLHIGDKMSNRHGTMGVVAQILPDDAMPHLPDGTPVDILYNFASLHRRLNFGQIREAVMGSIAHREGRPVIVPPFDAPSEDVLHARLVEVGLPDSGLETLTAGRNGPALEQPSTVGYVYWGRLYHLAQDKLLVYIDGLSGQVQGEMENFMLRDLSAFENVRENLNTRTARRPDSATLAARVAAGSVEQAPPPTPLFADLTHRLRMGGIEVALEDERLAFRFAPPTDDTLKLARPVPHPWLPGRQLTEIGVPGVLREGDDDILNLLWPPGGWQPLPETPPAVYTALVEANDRLARMLEGRAPQKLVESAAAQLESRVLAFFDALLTPVHLRLSERLLFSGRTVLVPDGGLTLEQVGMPDAMAWAYFGPLVTRELGGDTAAVAARTAQAAQTLDAVMARSWVIVNRAPTFTPTALLAFHPVRVPGYALHLHPLLCPWLNADFDGDQAAVLLPVTEAAQREAGEKLSVAGHLTRDPGLLNTLLPALDALWGLARLSLSVEGQAEIAQLVGEPVAAPGGFITRATLTEAMHKVLAREGVQGVLPRLELLMRRGFAVAQASGASLSSFVGASLRKPEAPVSDDPALWQKYGSAVTEALASGVDYLESDLGPQRLMVKARGVGVEQLAWLVGGRGIVTDEYGDRIVIRHGYAEGYTAEELFACVAGARQGFAEVTREWERLGASFRERNVSRSFNVLTRALRAKHPGLVFASAAAAGEVDPLADVESRLLVGLPV
jgi:hypothetical protein